VGDTASALFLCPLCITFQIYIQGCIQKLPNCVDNEIYAYKNKHSLKNNTEGYSSKSQNRDTTAPSGRELYLYSSRSWRPVRKLLNTPSSIWAKSYKINLHLEIMQDCYLGYIKVCQYILKLEFISFRSLCRFTFESTTKYFQRFSENWFHEATCQLPYNLENMIAFVD